MTDVFIYGDSFADPNWNMSHNCEFVWPVELAKKYTVNNFALKGTGPEYSLNKLVESRHLAKRKPSVCIFVVSDVNRMNLHNFWKHDQEQVHLLDVAAKRIKHPGYMFVRQLYEHYLVDHTHSLRAASAVSAVNSLSGAFDRTLIFTIAPITTSLRVDPSVDFVNHGLLDISEAEWKVDTGSDPYVDHRPNHLSAPNHRKMLELLVQWIDQGTVPDVAQFEQAIV